MKRQAGFTLLELLIAVTLLGLLMAALFGGLRLGVRAWEVSGERLDANARMEMVQHFLRGRLTQIYPVVGGTGRRSYLVFRGEPDELTFVTLLSERLGVGLALMSIRPGGEDQRSLQLRWRAFGAAAEETADMEATQTHTLLDGVERVEFRYYGTFEEGTPGAWHDEWIEATTLPKLIRMRVVFAPDDGRIWPDLVVRPMVDGTPTLLF